MSIVVSLQEIGPCRQQLKIQIPAPEVEQERSQVLREFSRSVSVPGFRKGKIPASVLRQRFGKEMDKEVVDRLLPRYWQQAQEEKQLDPLLPPELDEVGEVVSGEPLTFVATVETRPEIELTELGGFDLPELPEEPTEQEVQEALDDLRRRFAPWVTVERAAVRGDRVEVEITEIPDPALSEGEPAEPRTDTVEIEVGDLQVWEELSLAVTGLTAGQEARFSHRDPAPPPEAGSAGGAAPERHFQVKVREVKERDLPPLDDELAKSVADLDTLEELRDRVRQSLERQKKDHRSEKQREALMEQLRQRYPLSLPARVVEQEIENLVRDYAESLARRGVDLEKAEIDWRRVGEEARPQAERQVHGRLLLDAVAERESIVVEPDDLELALAAFARVQGTSVPALRRGLEEAGRLEGFRRQVRRNKTVRYLLGEAETTEAAASSVAP